MNPIEIPIQVARATGPGSQPEEQDGSQLDILQLPDGMNTFSLPDLPEAEAIKALSVALQTLECLLQHIQQYQVGQATIRMDVTDLNQENKNLLDQIFGEGEVSIVYEADFRAEIQESVLAGVWRMKQFNPDKSLRFDMIEVAAIPNLVRQHSFFAAQKQVTVDKTSIPKDVLNAPPLIVEINDRIKQLSQQGKNSDLAHVINLSLLPQTEQDIQFLSEQLGQGVTTILSRGYGNCRISSTATEKVWWVQYFNSQDSNILNSLEIVDIPNVACAAQEDIEDSAQRLEEILEAYR